MSKLQKTIKEKFGYDVAALPAWQSNTLPNIITDLINNVGFLDSMTLEDGIKGSRDIALLTADVTLKAKVGCTPSPDGSVIFTEKTLNTVLLQAGIEFCNETLNTKMTEVLNRLGLKAQNGQLPAELENILMAYLLKLLQRKAQRLVVAGDVLSLDAELLLMDGLLKKINAGAGVVTYTSPEVAITSANAYNIAYGMFKAIDTELFDNGEVVNIYCGRSVALLILEDWNNANPYSQVSVPTDVGSSMTFTLPLTNVSVISLPELNGVNNKMYAFPPRLCFLGIDSPEDMTFDVKYDAYADKLKAECSFRLGTEIVFNQYFVKLALT